MLKLAASSGESASAMIPIRWCVDRGTLGAMQAKGIRNPHLLLVITFNGSEVDRKLVPIENLMEYVEFHKPGTHRIFAIVVWNPEGNITYLKKRILGGKIGEVRFRKMEVIDNEGNLDLDLEMGDSFPKKLKELKFLNGEGKAELDVNIAPELFAKEPSQFEKWWVNFWFENKAPNQCVFRKRRVPAYTIQPLVVLIWMFTKMSIRYVVALFLLLYGQRGLRFSPLIHPWQEELNDIWYRAMRPNRGSVFLDKNRNTGEEQPIWLVLAMPLPHVLAFILVYIVALAGNYFGGWIMAPLWKVVIIAEGIVGICYLGLLAGFGLIELTNYMDISRENRKKVTHIIAVSAILFFVAFAATTIGWLLYHSLAVGIAFASFVLLVWRVEILINRYNQRKVNQENYKKVLLERQYAKYQTLVCNGPLVPNVRALPKERQTVYLWFKDLQGKVCKPYAS